MPEYMPTSAKPYMPRSARPVQPQEEVGAGETVVNTAVGWLPAGNRIVDAGSALALDASRAIGRAAPGLSRAMSSLPVVGQFAPAADSDVRLTPQAKAEMERLGIAEETPTSDPSLVDTYREVRDRRAQRTEAGAQQNPWAARFGNALGLGLSLAAPLPKVGTGLKGAVATGAGYGALHGLTEGKADLTRGEVGQALVDTGEGALWGGGAGALGYGLMRLGQRGVQALRNARSDTLAQETEKLGAEAQAAQAAAAKEAEAARKEIGQAREMNKAFDRKAAAQAERAQKVLQRARGSAPARAPAEPDTRILEGMYGKAHQAQQSRTKDALQYQRQMGEPDVPTKVSESWQEYIDRAPEALSNPPALRRQYMEDYLRQKYGNEVAERLLAERIGPAGEVLPRPSAAPAAAPEPEVLAALPQRRPGNMAYDVGGQRGPEFSKQLTAGGAQPSLADEAEAAMAARRAAAAGADIQRGAAPVAKSASPEASTPNAPRPVADPVLTAPPARRPGASPLALDMGGKPGMNMEPTPITPPGAPTANLRQPSAPPAPSYPPVEEVTRLAGPEDVGALSAERANAREHHALRAVFGAGYQGLKEGRNTLGALVGGVGGVGREVLKDPAVKARVLSLAKVQYLAQVNPELFARVGAPLTAAVQSGDDARYKAQKYLQIRTHPELRKAEKEASEAVSRMSDQQLMELIASGAPAQ